jgi:1-deoxy-D-xylulose-5-phosphate reductoisomerase
MGPKISVDSATMMNKALEVIEACWLFETVPDRIEVVIHPQSTVHSMVEYEDGSILAQLGTPDMRTPIAHALAWPERIDSGVSGLDFSRPLSLDFEPPDFGWAPCLRLGYEAARAGGTLPTVLNAANEVAVAAFLDRRAAFNTIPRVVEETLGRCVHREADTLDTVLDEDAAAREIAAALVG